jgi:hypothetical protein
VDKESTIARCVARVLDGERVWGSLEAGPERRGFRSYQLIVYPPGIDRIGRRYLRLARSWPVLGAALWLLSFVFFSGAHSPWVALAVSTLSYLGGALVVNAFAGQSRSQVRSLRVTRIAGYDDPAMAARYAQLETLANRLLRADTLRTAQQLSALEHEAIWWSVYDHLDSGKTAQIA